MPARKQQEAKASWAKQTSLLCWPSHARHSWTPRLRKFPSLPVWGLRVALLRAAWRRGVPSMTFAGCAQCSWGSAETSAEPPRRVVTISARLLVETRQEEQTTRPRLWPGCSRSSQPIEVLLLPREDQPRLSPRLFTGLFIPFPPYPRCPSLRHQDPMPYPKLTLYYFDIAARAEVARLLFTLGGVPFEVRWDRIR